MKFILPFSLDHREYTLDDFFADKRFDLGECYTFYSRKSMNMHRWLIRNYDRTYEQNKYSLQMNLLVDTREFFFLWESHSINGFRQIAIKFNDSNRKWYQLVFSFKDKIFIPNKSIPHEKICFYFRQLSMLSIEYSIIQTSWLWIKRRTIRTIS